MPPSHQFDKKNVDVHSVVGGGAPLMIYILSYRQQKVAQHYWEINFSHRLRKLLQKTHFKLVIGKETFYILSF